MVTLAARFKLALVLALLIVGLLPSLARADAWDEVVAAERAFAAQAQVEGVRAAFLAALAPESVVFAPGPQSGQAVWRAKPADGIRLEWAPAAAEVAQSGDLGYTYGPWRYTPEGGKTPVGFGHYLTVWQRQADGGWQVLVDHGVDHGPVPFPDQVQRHGGTSVDRPDPGPFQALGLAELRQADLLAPGELQPKRAAADLVVLRDRALPSSVPQAPALPVGTPGRIESGAAISAAGDLAVSWGGGARSPSWLRVWRRPSSSDPPGLGWRLAVDLAKPAPSSAQE